jgi:hypothetical protein
MGITKALITAVLYTTLAVSALAQDNNSQRGQQGGAPGDAIYLDPTPFIQEVDTNKDGNVSREEWLAVGLLDDLYSRFDKQNRGYITKEEMAAMYHPPAMDPEKSGKFTVAMLRAHIARQTAGGGGQQSSGNTQSSQSK